MGGGRSLLTALTHWMGLGAAPCPRPVGRGGRVTGWAWGAFGRGMRRDVTRRARERERALAAAARTSDRSQPPKPRPFGRSAATCGHSIPSSGSRLSFTFGSRRTLRSRCACGRGARDQRHKRRVGARDARNCSWSSATCRGSAHAVPGRAHPPSMRGAARAQA
eukprot:4454448-Prymnesium_polylepis.2